MKPKVFLTRQLPPLVMERLHMHTDLEVNPEDRVLSKQEIQMGIQGKDGLLCLLTDTIDGELLDANPNLKIVANYAVGFNNIDVEAATKRGIPVTNTPGVLTETSADMAFALMLAVGRRVVEADRFARTGTWKGWGPLQFLGTDVSGSTLGIIGMGRIGKAVARRASGFNMRVLYWNRTRMTREEEHALGVSYGAFEEVLKHGDFVSLNIAYHSDTHHLIDAAALRAMKQTSFLINTARGAVVDEQALMKALQRKQIAGAGLDVFEHEPRISPELREMDQVVLLPHLASATIETRTKMGMIAVDNLLARFAGIPLPNLVNKEVVY